MESDTPFRWKIWTPTLEEWNDPEFQRKLKEDEEREYRWNVPGKSKKLNEDKQLNESAPPDKVNESGDGKSCIIN